MIDALASARTFLFVPGNQPARFSKALHSGADAIVIDLEDSVPAHEKTLAREAITAAWDALGAAAIPVVVRINAPTANHALHEEELRWLANLSRLAGVMTPKTESGAVINTVRQAAPAACVLPLIESAAGYANLTNIANSAGVLRLVLGHLDLMVDTGINCGQDEIELAPTRFAMTIATRLASLAPPVDGVTQAIVDEARLRADVQRSMRFGFGGKLCIHPRQVATVHDVMTPSHDELAWAQRVIEANEISRGAAIQVDGRMVDAPVVARARRLLGRVCMAS
jgi:citrate lyase subunit beta/citryl-CoA lyase